MTRAFASLNPQEALHIAIFIEDRNADIYQRFAEMFTEFRDTESLEIASVFWDMSAEEKRHGAWLRNTYTEHFGSAVCPLTEEHLRELIEVPKLESGDVFESTEATQRTARERALQVALTAEQTAHEFYTRLAAQTAEGPMRRLYSELSVMEDGHVEVLLNLMREAPAEGPVTIQ